MSHFDGLMQDCSIFNALTMEILVVLSHIIYIWWMVFIQNRSYKSLEFTRPWHLQRLPYDLCTHIYEGCFINNEATPLKIPRQI